jgi:hypothetical protein
MVDGNQSFKLFEPSKTWRRMYNKGHLKLLEKWDVV